MLPANQILKGENKMFTTLIDEELKNENWINTRMKRVVAEIPAQKWHENFCPECKVHATRHNDAKCSMRFTEEL